MPPDSADPQDDNLTVQAGGTLKVANDKKDKFALTTTLTVVEGEVAFAAKGPIVTPTGCGNRCMIRVWTDTASAGSFTPVSDQDLTAAAAAGNEVDYARTLKKGDKIRYEGDLDVTLSSASGDAKVRRHRTKDKPA
jgi:hypothetical protein